VPVVPRRTFRPYLPALVAAAALVVMGFGSGLWMMVDDRGDGNAPQVADVPGSVDVPPAPPPSMGTGPVVAPAPPVEALPKPRPTPRTPGVVRVKATTPAPTTAETVVAEHRSSPKPLFDFDTASHIEQTELMLRSFMNAKTEGTLDATQIAYEKRRSRELLDRNVLLRLGAESKGNFPTEDVLGSVEPYLLDIANLKEDASPSDVRAIQERLAKREIVADLQLYAMNGPKMGF
jgi:hypothetical protein